MTITILGFVAGLLWLSQQARLPSNLLLFLAVALLSSGALLCVRRMAGWRYVSGVLLLTIGAALGVAWGGWRAELRLAESLPAALEGHDVRLSGTIATLPQRIERGWRFEFVLDDPAALAQGMPQRIGLAWYDMGFRDGTDLRVPPLQAGDRWQLTARLRRPHGNLNRLGFDFEALLFERGLRATGYVRPRDQIPQQLGASGDYAVERWRAAIRERFLRALPDEPHTGVLVALAIGDQQAVPRGQWDVFARTGITHLVSISGLHITLLAGLAATAIGYLWRRSAWLMRYLPAQQAALVGGLLAAFAYCLLAGFGVPAQRTLYMLAIVGLALWSRRNPAARDVLALAILPVLLLDPWAVQTAGFWLSFGAVALLFLVGSGRIGKVHWLRHWGRAQWAMSVGLLPMLLLLFQQFSLASPIANAVAIPLMSFVITPLALLAAIPGFEFLLQPAHALLAALMWLMQWLADLPFSAWQQAAAPLHLTVLAALGMLFLLLPAGLPGRWLGCVPLMVLLFWAPERPLPGAMQVSVLDVGQGLAVHVQTARHDLLFDAGPAFSEEADSGNRIILPWLRAKGVSQLDALVITHADNDHSGGAESLVNGVPVAHMYSSVPFENTLAALPVQQSPCASGQHWDWDGVRFLFLHPQADDYTRESGKSNDMSCVLKLESVHGSLLLTGDIEAKSELRLVQDASALLASNVMLVPHHGSRTSSTPEFLAAVNPESVIFTVGYQNRFHHPHPAVLARYAERTIYRTDRDGALTLEYSEGAVHISKARDERRRYWHE